MENTLNTAKQKFHCHYYTAKLMYYIQHTLLMHRFVHCDFVYSQNHCGNPCASHCHTLV
jgi:hypothetical protein